MIFGGIVSDKYPEKLVSIRSNCQELNQEQDMGSASSYSGRV